MGAHESVAHAKRDGARSGRMGRPSRLLRLGLLAGAIAFATFASAAQSRLAPLSYEAVALDWSAAEVERETASTVDAIIERARRAGLFGCALECDRMAQIFDRLLVPARLQSERSGNLRWSLTVLRTPEVEAMALPDGQVLISEVFTRSRDLCDEALAFVIAHEMAHSILEHERQSLHFARMLLPRGVHRSVPDMYVELAYNFALLKSLEPVMQQGELEADELGLLLASAAGFAPHRQLEFVEQEAARGPAPGTLIHTHPTAARRLKALRMRQPLAEGIFAAAGTTRP